MTPTAAASTQADRGSAGWPAFTAEHRADLVHYARRRLGRSPVAGHDAEDVVQEVLLRMLGRDAVDTAGAAADRSGQAIDRPVAYLRRAVANECVTRWRRHRELPTEQLPDRAEGDHADRCCTGVTVHAALAMLTDRQREILTRRYLLDHHDDEIATELGISPVTVRTLRRRGLAHLRRVLGVPVQPRQAGAPLRIIA
ncbi:MAG TPA: sigma-70 family RNA polymerase sigma factor [Mycobacteriales bacterium]|nr:sigma-70 family RNA polymerase sigma factor [Mycobacteriales bacterium]